MGHKKTVLLILCLGGVGGCTTDREPVNSTPSVHSAEAQTSVVAAETTQQVDPQGVLQEQQLAVGWIQLFDGESLFGWTANSNVNWQVVDGVLRADEGTPGLLLTSVPFTDYELKCDFHLARGGNSGVFLRTTKNPKDPSQDCYELNICDSHATFPTGSLVARQRGPEGLSVEEEWHTFHVRIEGQQINVKLDGKPVLDFVDQSETPRHSGQVGLQMNGGAVRFRNVLLRPLGTRAVFNGKDLSGWREVPGGKSRFAALDGAIHVENGPGFLETEETWKNFVLQAQARTNGVSLNSGIFFRAAAGTAEAPSNGYEVQIHNEIKNGDVRQPANAGTGAIFRRNTARFVLSQDEEWCFLTLVAHESRFAVWVNGLQVTDWQDRRAADENPRRGLRLAAGHLSLQGHDPTTNLDFRDVRVGAAP